MGYSVRSCTSTVKYFCIVDINFEGDVILVKLVCHIKEFYGITSTGKRHLLLFRGTASNSKRSFVMENNERS